jgi:hypothetical protein
MPKRKAALLVAAYSLICLLRPLITVPQASSPELVRAGRLGFDGVCVNEHHQTAYGMMPSPIIIASILARETKNVKIAILGSAIPLRDHPLTPAEEHATIDTISGGRLIRAVGHNKMNSRCRDIDNRELSLQCFFAMSML